MSDTPDDTDMLAAEYVLGSLDGDTAASVVAQAQTDPALQTAILAWQERLTPLALLAPPVRPPASLWDRLAVSTGARTARRPGALASGWRSLTLWRFAAASGFAVAAALAAFIVLRPPPERSLAALVPAGSAAAVFVAELGPNGSLRLIALQPIPVAQGKDLELWALPAGASRPVALGVLPPSGRSLVPPNVPATQTQLLVSLEPQGGSPTGQPTGPVLFGGTLRDGLAGARYQP